MFWPILIASLSFWSAALGGAFYLGRRYVRAIEARNVTDAQLATLQQQIASLEATIVRHGLTTGERADSAPALGAGASDTTPRTPNPARLGS